MFQLHPRLNADTLPIARLRLSELRLMNDSRFPWLILIPMRQGITEIHQLEFQDQQRLIEESSLVSKLLMDFFRPDKINIAALGNGTGTIPAGLAPSGAAARPRPMRNRSRSL